MNCNSPMINRIFITLHVTLMQGMGLERDCFVDGAGRLTGLS